MTMERDRGADAGAAPHEPYVIRVGRRDCTFELPPKMWNAWDEAIENGMIYEDAAEYWDDHRDHTNVMFVGEKRTLKITLNVPPKPAAMFKTIRLPRMAANGVKVKDGAATFRSKRHRPLTVVIGEWVETTKADMTEIERIRRRREDAGRGTQRRPGADAGKIESGPTAPPSTPVEWQVRAATANPHEAGANTQTAAAPETHSLQPNQVCGKLQVIEPERRLIYANVLYMIRGKKQWEIISRLIAGDGMYVSLQGLSKNPRGVFSKGKAKTFFEAAVQPEGIGRLGTKRYKLLK